MNNKNTKFYLDLIIRNGHKGHIKKRKVDIKKAEKTVPREENTAAAAYILLPDYCEQNIY